MLHGHHMAPRSTAACSRGSARLLELCAQSRGLRDNTSQGSVAAWRFRWWKVGDAWESCQVVGLQNALWSCHSYIYGICVGCVYIYILYSTKMIDVGYHLCALSLDSMLMEVYVCFRYLLVTLWQSKLAVQFPPQKYIPFMFRWVSHLKRRLTVSMKSWSQAKWF